MIDVITYYLVKGIAEKLEFADVWAGLVKPLRKKVNNVDKVFPVAINLPSDCNMSDYMALVPDSGKRSILYAELVDKPEVVSSNSRYSQVEASIKLVCWYNLDKITKGDYISVDYLAKRLQSLVPRTIPNMPASGVSSINFAVMGIEYGTSIVNKYSYNEIKTQFGTHPYGMFALDIDVWYISTVLSDCSNPFDIEAGCITGSGGHGTAVAPPEPPTPPEPTDGWVRPADWLPIPDIPEGDQRLYGLFAVYDDDSNFVAFRFEGDYNVDWGDGVIEAYSSGDAAEHRFNYADFAGTECSRGYRQALITVTPQSGNNFTDVFLPLRHSAVPVSNYYSAAWLEIVMRGEFVSTLKISDPWNQDGNISMHHLESFSMLGENLIEDFSSSFSYLLGLEYVNINTQSGTDFSGMFDSCYSLKEVPLLNTQSGTVFSGMFSGCYSLKEVPLLNTQSGTVFSGMFDSCYSLREVPLLNTQSGTVFSGMFSNCYTLREVPLLNTQSGTVFSGMFNSCYSLSNVKATGFSRNIDFLNCLLSRGALIEIFNNLATVVGMTINVSGNWGVANLTPADIAIAENKGWTVIT